MITSGVLVDAPGGPEVLQWRDIDVPLPAKGEVLVETAFAGVNFHDVYVRSGVYPATFPLTLGAEASGTVIAVGEGVTDVVPGDQVVTIEARGSYAHHFLADSAHVMKLPSGIDLATAAALAYQGLTAHYLANSTANLQDGDTVLVDAGAGGVGLLLTQLLRARGVRVFTTASTHEKRKISRAAGAEASFAYEDVAVKVREHTAGHGVNVVYDGVGGATFDDSLAALAPRGHLVLFGGTGGHVEPIDPLRLALSGSLSLTRPVLGHYLATPEERAWRYGELFDAVLEGTLEVRIEAHLSLREATHAHTLLAGRGTSGKLLLDVVNQTHPSTKQGDSP